MNYSFHTPIENRSYRIKKRTGMIEYLQDQYPHHQHRILAFACYRTFNDDLNIFTQKVLQEELRINKGTISRILNKMVDRGHIEIKSKSRPYWYGLTPGGEQYARYVFCHFPYYRLDIFRYYYKAILVDFWGLSCFKESHNLLRKAEKEYYDPSIDYWWIFDRIISLPTEICLEFTKLFVMFTDMSEDERRDMLRYRVCPDFKRIYELLEEEFQIRYRLNKLIQLNEEMDNYHSIMPRSE